MENIQFQDSASDFNLNDLEIGDVEFVNVTEGTAFPEGGASCCGSYSCCSSSSC